MIEELANGMSELDDKTSDDQYIPEDALSRARYMIGCPMAISSSTYIEVLKKAYVCHGSTRVIL
jgi:hypothetical protein